MGCTTITENKKFTKHQKFTKQNRNINLNTTISWRPTLTVPKLPNTINTIPNPSKS